MAKKKQSTVTNVAIAVILIVGGIWLIDPSVFSSSMNRATPAATAPPPAESETLPVAATPSAPVQPRATPATTPAPKPTAEVVRARLVPFRTPDGIQTKMILVDWRNTGPTVIRAVDVVYAVYDSRGNILDSSKKQAVYAVSDDAPGIAPGQTYREPNGKGYILGPIEAQAARRVEVEIVEVVETGAW